VLPPGRGRATYRAAGGAHKEEPSMARTIIRMGALRGRPRGSVVAAAWLATAALTLAACTASSQSAAPSSEPPGSQSESAAPTAEPTPQPVDANLRLDFTINGKHSAFLVGIAKGFFSDVGINLTVAEGRGSLASAQLVVNKDDPFAFVDATSAANLIAEGAPVKMVAIFSQQTPTAAISFDTLDSPEDLKGKVIGFFALGSVPLPWEAFKARNGLSTSDFTEINLEATSLLPALLAGDIDVDLGLVNAEGAAAPVLSGNPVNMLRFADWGVNALAHGILVHQDTIDENPDLVRRFVEASVRSWEYTVEHPDEAVDALMAAFPEANREIIENQLELSLELIHTANSEGQTLGWMAPEDWQATIDLLVDYGGLQNDVPVRDYYTNDFIPAN
jgi:NitT/TauT family transport system substrate-binding protein